MWLSIISGKTTLEWYQTCLLSVSLQVFRIFMRAIQMQVFFIAKHLIQKQIIYNWPQMVIMFGTRAEFTRGQSGQVPPGPPAQGAPLKSKNNAKI